MTLATLREFFLQNTSIRQTIIKNSLWTALGQVTARATRAIVVIYAARTLGATAWGEFSYVLGLVGLCTIFIESGGLYNLVLREWSKDEKRGIELFYAALVLKLLILSLSFGIFLITYFVTPPLDNKGTLFLVIAIVALFDSIRELFSLISRAKERFEIEAIVQTVSGAALVFIAAGLFFLLERTSVMLALAYLWPPFLSVALYVWIFRKSLCTGQWTRYIDFRSLGQIFFSALPLSVFGFLGMITLNTDIILIGYFQSFTAVGLYAAAQRIIQIAFVVPGLFISPLFPVFSRLSLADPDRIRQALVYGMYASIVIAVPMAFLSMLFGESIMSVAYGRAYTAAGTSFQILGVSLLFYFPWTLLSVFAVSIDNTKTIVAAVIANIILNAILDVVFIPLFGINGAALSTLVTIACTVIYAFIAMRRYFTREVFVLLARPLAAGSVVLLCASIALFAGASQMAVLIGFLMLYAILLLATNDPLVHMLRHQNR